MKLRQTPVCIIQGHVFSGIGLNGCGPLEVLDGLSHKGPLHELVGGLDQVWVGLGSHLAVLKVVGECLDNEGDAPTVHPLERLADASVVQPAVLEGSLFNEDIFEAIAGQLEALGLSNLPLSDEACGDELIHAHQQGLLIGLTRHAQQPKIHFLSGHCQHTDHCACRSAQGL